MMALTAREFRANAYVNIQYLLYLLYFDKNRQVLGFFGFVATNGLDDLANIRRSLVSLDCDKMLSQLCESLEKCMSETRTAVN